MASSPSPLRGSSPRRSILDLAPLELDCMNTLWPLGEGTVREIQQALAPMRPRAYTTIMTIMDRLAHKGVVTREKIGRAYIYRPRLSAQEARAHAIEQVVAGFFEGSPAALAEHLAGLSVETPAGARLARSNGQRVPSSVPAPVKTREKRVVSAKPTARREEEPEALPGTRLDETLL